MALVEIDDVLLKDRHCVLQEGVLENEVRSSLIPNTSKSQRIFPVKRLEMVEPELDGIHWVEDLDLGGVRSVELTNAVDGLKEFLLLIGRLLANDCQLETQFVLDRVFKEV